MAISYQQNDTTGTPKMSNLPEPLTHREDVGLGAQLDWLGELWLRCLALGTMYTPTQLEALLRGEARATRHEYNLVAVALNEWLSDVGVSQFVPYVEDDAPGYLSASWSRSAASPAALSSCDQWP